jgi:hypothetical protein
MTNLPLFSPAVIPLSAAGNLGGNATCLTRSVRGVSTGFSSTRHGEGNIPGKERNLG